MDDQKRYYTKKLLLFIVCFAAASLCLFGCGKREESNSVTVNGKVFEAEKTDKDTIATPIVSDLCDTFRLEPGGGSVGSGRVQGVYGRGNGGH